MRQVVLFQVFLGLLASPMYARPLIDNVVLVRGYRCTCPDFRFGELIVVLLLGCLIASFSGVRNASDLVKKTRGGRWIVDELGRDGVKCVSTCRVHGTWIKLVLLRQPVLLADRTRQVLHQDSVAFSCVSKSCYCDSEY